MATTSAFLGNANAQQMLLMHPRSKVLVAGVRNVGKSTFWNAILKTKDLLPTSALGCTSRVTLIKYAEQPEATLTLRAGSGIDAERKLDVERRVGEDISGTLSAGQPMKLPDWLVGRGDIAPDLRDVVESVLQVEVGLPFARLT